MSFRAFLHPLVGPTELRSVACNRGDLVNACDFISDNLLSRPIQCIDIPICDEYCVVFFQCPADFVCNYLDIL